MKKIIRLKSISEVHKFYNLPKPKHPLISVIYFDEGVLNADYGEYTYVFDFFQISLKEGVKGNLHTEEIRMILKKVLWLFSNLISQ